MSIKTLNIPNKVLTIVRADCRVGRSHLFTLDRIIRHTGVHWRTAAALKRSAEDKISAEKRAQYC